MKKDNKLIFDGPYVVLDIYCHPVSELREDETGAHVDSYVKEGHFDSAEFYRPDIYLFDFQGDIDSREAVEEMKKRGFRPANFRENWLLGKNYPHLQEDRVIVALGNIWWDQDRLGNVTALTMTYSDSQGQRSRYVRTYFLDNKLFDEKNWMKKDGNFVFAAVKITHAERQEGLHRYLTNCLAWWGYDQVV